MSDGRQGERYAQGWERFKEVNGSAAEKLRGMIDEVAPDFGRYVVEYAYGDIYNRPGLDIRRREMVAIAVLAAKGTVVPQLKSHIHGALNVGVTRAEIVETFVQLAAYTGFPAAINAVMAARDVFEVRDARGLNP